MNVSDSYSYPLVRESHPASVPFQLETLLWIISRFLCQPSFSNHNMEFRDIFLFSNDRCNGQIEIRKGKTRLIFERTAILAVYDYSV